MDGCYFFFESLLCIVSEEALLINTHTSSHFRKEPVEKPGYVTPSIAQGHSITARDNP